MILLNSKPYKLRVIGLGPNTLSDGGNDQGARGSPSDRFTAVICDQPGQLFK